jgi:putative MATE family efflux protein
MNTSAPLTHGPIGRTLIAFALPILFGNVLQSMNGSVNSIWVGRFLGEAALTATANANSILFLLIGGVFGVSMAATILVAQYVGAGATHEARRVVGTSATFFALVAVSIAALGWLGVPRLLAAMHTPAAAVPLARDYLRIIFIAVPFIYLYTFVMAVLRGAGDSQTPFKFLLLSVGLDIALNPLLIFGAGPVPKLGIAGSALATLIANAVSLAALVAHLYRRQHVLCLRGPDLRLLRLDASIVGTLLRKGLPMGLQLLLVSANMLALVSLVNRFGTDTSAAYGATWQLWNYLQMPAFALGAAVSSMAAQNVGAGRWDRVHRIAGAGVAFHCAATGTLILALVALNRLALGLFLPPGPALDIAGHINLTSAWSFLFFGISMVLFGVVRSTGAVVPPLVILLVALWGVRLPLAVSLAPRFGADAIWWSFPLASCVSALLAVSYYRFGGWRAARMTPALPKPAGSLGTAHAGDAARAQP